MAKNANGLVAYCQAQLGKPYWYGTFGQKATEKLWNDKAAQYPKYYTTIRKNKASKLFGTGVKVHDCSGLIKGYMMCESADAEPKYLPEYDFSANAFYSRAQEKGSIKTIPEIPGIAVWRNNHIGVYIGGGNIIEAKGFDYGVIMSNLKGCTFTNWCKIPGIDYSESVKVEDAPKPNKIYKKGVVIASILNVRSGKGTNYSIVGQLARGAEVSLLDKGENGWYHISGGYVSADYIATDSSSVKHVSVNTYLNIRKSPNTSSEIIGRLENGNAVVVKSTTNGWSAIQTGTGTGYVSAKYLI